MKLLLRRLRCWAMAHGPLINVWTDLGRDGCGHQMRAHRFDCMYCGAENV
jgi:hypothetical protein